MNHPSLPGAFILFVKNLKYVPAKILLDGFILFVLLNGYFELSGASSCKSISYMNVSSPDTTSHKESFIKGRITQFITNTPVYFADIFNSNKTSFTKSNSKGEFVLGPLEFPVTLRIRKFGFKEEKIIVNNPGDSVLISLAPLEVHNSYSGNIKLLQYSLIFRRALENLRAGYSSESGDNSQRELVYSRISISAGSSVNSLFESYAQMSVSRNGFLDYQPRISRYASANDFIPGLSGNMVEFTIDPYVNLPMFIERYITRKAYLLQDGNQIAMVRVDLGNTKNTYYINVADTSILYITSQFSTERKNRIPGSQSILQGDKTINTEISFSHNRGNSDVYYTDWATINEEFRLIQRHKPDQVVSKNTLFVIVPDSSIISNAVRDQVSQEALTEIRQQINFRGRYSLSDISSAFKSETEKLLLKPYSSEFWTQNSCVTLDINEQKQINSWEDGNLFYSENLYPGKAETPEADSLVMIMNNNLVEIENVYIETDRQDYLAGDTIWFSAFVLDNMNMDSTWLSKILYVDLINADNKPEKHLKLFIRNGRSCGDFVLGKDTKNGIYRIRAYTQYMRSFQSEYLFEKDISVHKSDFSNSILVNPVINKSTEGDSVELYIKTILPDEYKSQEKKLEVVARLNDTLSVRKTFSILKYLNEMIGFFVPAELSCAFVDIKLILSDKAVISEQRLSIPLKSGINLRFFPESGKMVDGISTVIAFKASDDKGYPAEFNADIVDEDNNTIKHISGNSSGAGKFEFTPGYNHAYKAIVNQSGSKYSFKLPGVEPRGYILNFNSESSDIIIKNNQVDFNNRHYLLISVRGVVYDYIETKLDIEPHKIHLPLEMYPKGIVQITLFDSLFRPLAERLVFNNRSDHKMNIKIETDKKIYSQREKIHLTIYVTDAEGNPVSSTLSLAVLDATKSDSSIIFPDIESYLYLTSELKGEIDYRLLNLSDTTNDGNIKRDLVMMTQGWRNYLWNSIRYTNALKELYPIEKGFSIDGTLFNYSRGRSCSGFKLNYLDFKSGFHGVTEVDENNQFRIDLPLFYDSHVYFIQNTNSKDKIGNLGFVLDTFSFPVISYRKNELPFKSYKPGYLKALDKKFSEIDTTGGSGIKYINLPEVQITAKSDRSGYLAPDITIDLDKEDVTGKKYSSLFQLIYEEFGEKAFTATGYGTHGNMYSPILVVNGAPMTAAECPPCHDFSAYSWASGIPVSQISDVKFYEAESKYSQWLTPPPPIPRELKKGLYLPPPDPKIYLPVVAIKTYSGSYRGNPRGAILIPIQGLNMAREFYKPDYGSKNSQIPDHRTTIYWDPEIKTDSTGTVNVSFYNSDLKGKALIRISGVSFYLKDASSSSSGYVSY